MSREDGVILASRTLALLLLVWALAELSNLPASFYAFRHYWNVDLRAASETEYYRHSHLMALSFLVGRIIAFSLLSRWLFRGGPEVLEMLLPADVQETNVQS